jgi:hypothetical protein
MALDTLRSAMKSTATSIVPAERIERAILLIRGRKAMLDADLAVLYGVPTKVLNQAVRRNLERFPEDFMFQLTWKEARELSRSQIVTLKRGLNPKYRPIVFTEQGVAMLSGVLRSGRAIAVNIAIMRAFVRLRAILSSHVELSRRLDELERKSDAQFKVVFDSLRKLILPAPRGPRSRIGFRLPGKQL